MLTVLTVLTGGMFLASSDGGVDFEVIARWTLLGYGIFLVLGGVLGYVLPKTPSKVSLIAGTATGAIAIVAYFVAATQPVAGFITGVVVASVNELMMALRLKKTKKFMPAGMIVIVSGLVLATLVIGLVMRESGQS